MVGPTPARGGSFFATTTTACWSLTGESPFPTAPRFRDLYLRYDVQLLSEALVEGIVTAHPEMPQFEFDPDQAQAILLYLSRWSQSGGVGRLNPSAATVSEDEV